MADPALQPIDQLGLKTQPDQLAAVEAPIDRVVEIGVDGVVAVADLVLVRLAFPEVGAGGAIDDLLRDAQVARQRGQRW